MAANLLPKIIDVLFHMVERIVQGLLSLEAGLPPEHHHATRLLAALETARNAEVAYQTGRGKWDGSVRPEKQSANDALRKFIIKARTRLKLVLGEAWNSNWAVAGFVSASLAMPKTLAERAGLVADLQRFLAAHPEHEDAKLGITAQEAEGVRGMYVLATQGHDAQRSSQKELAAKRDEAVRALRRRTRNVIEDLREAIGDNDPRWSRLGLNAPGAPATTRRIPESTVEPGTSDRLRAVDGAADSAAKEAPAALVA